MGDTLDNLLTAATGYFGDQQKNDAQIQLAKLGVNPVTGQAPTPVPTTTTTTPAATAAPQWIPGVSNSTVILGAGALIAGLVLIAVLKK